MSEPPALPFVPEPLSKLRSRYQAALIKVFDCRCGTPYPRPGQLRGHVFDFEDGMRLVISRERMSETEQRLHVSASFAPGTEIANRLDCRDLTTEQFLDLALETFARLSDDHGPLEFIDATPERGIPHWRRAEPID